MPASILIVDDEEAIRTSLRSILEDEGYDVAVAASGTEALKIYTTDPPDVMILDIWMPELDGLETLKRVKEFVPTAEVMMMFKKDKYKCDPPPSDWREDVYYVPRVLLGTFSCWY